MRKPFNKIPDDCPFWSLARLSGFKNQSLGEDPDESAFSLAKSIKRVIAG
jgi:hypothetical protein